ncbi:MAG: hypothetical protein ACM3JQ_05385 [Candidatus Eiseniibacteriota bacterium]
MIRTRFGGNLIWSLRSAAFQFDYQKEIEKFSKRNMRQVLTTICTA